MNLSKIQLKLFLAPLLAIIALGMSTTSAQGVLHNIQLNGGLVSAPGADLYLGKLDYIPQFKLSNDAIRIGINTGIYYSGKSVHAVGGINSSVRIHRFSTLNQNFTLGGIYLRAAHEWSSNSEKVLSGAFSFEFTQIAFNITYGRDLHFDNNWISYGFSLLFTKAETDPDE